MRLIDADALMKKFNNQGIQITFNLPVEKVLGEDVDIDDFSMLVQDAVQAYRKMVIGVIKEQPTISGTIIDSGEYPYYNGYKDGKRVGYNKAIDDFSNKMKYEYENATGIFRKECDFALAIIEMVAEQLWKEGESNERV